MGSRLKGKGFSVQDMKACRESIMALVIRDFSSSWRGVIISRFRLLYPR